MSDSTSADCRKLPAFDTAVASPARIWDYWVGGHGIRQFLDIGTGLPDPDDPWGIVTRPIPQWQGPRPPADDLPGHVGVARKP